MTTEEAAARVQEFCRRLKARVVSIDGPEAHDLVRLLKLPYEVKVKGEPCAKK